LTDKLENYYKDYEYGKRKPMNMDELTERESELLVESNIFVLYHGFTYMHSQMAEPILVVWLIWNRKWVVCVKTLWKISSMERK